MFSGGPKNNSYVTGRDKTVVWRRRCELAFRRLKTVADEQSLKPFEILEERQVHRCSIDCRRDSRAGHKLIQIPVIV